MQLPFISSFFNCLTLQSQTITASAPTGALHEAQVFQSSAQALGFPKSSTQLTLSRVRAGCSMRELRPLHRPERCRTLPSVHLPDSEPFSDFRISSAA